MEVRYPPLKRGISAILARYPMETRQMGAIPPSAILSRKGIARYGGVSRTGPLREFLAFLSVFSFFSRDFRGSEEMENPCFLVDFPCVFSKRQGTKLSFFFSKENTLNSEEWPNLEKRNSECYGPSSSSSKFFVP